MWEESLSEGVSRSVWNVGMSGSIILIVVTEVQRLRHYGWYHSLGRRSELF